MGDWYDYGHGKAVGASQFTPIELSAMATFHRCARVVAEAAGALGRADDQRRYQELAAAIARAFNSRYFDGQAEYKNLGSPQTANSMALVTGMALPGREPLLIERVIGDLRQRGGQQTAGDIGHWYLLQALAAQGRHEVINDMTSRTNLGSYGFIVNNGWTSMPEAWDANTGASMNHCMLGHIQEWFLGHLAGIRPDPAGPGFKRFVVAPQPVSGLTWARGEHLSPCGRIVSDWKLSQDRFVLRVQIPINTSATVFLPTTAPDSIRERGRPSAAAAGVKLLRPERTATALDVAGGDYEFECLLRPGTGR